VYRADMPYEYTTRNRTPAPSKKARGRAQQTVAHRRRRNRR
jgi:hypothetical protein